MKYHSFSMTYSKECDKALEWCVESFGEQNATINELDWYYLKVWGKGYLRPRKPISYQFFFKKQEDAALFILRWK